MSTYKTRVIENALSQKGFKKKESHHKKYTLYINGKRTSIYTFVSHGTKEYGDNLLNKMKNQLHISREELNDLIDCPLKHEDLVRILADKKFLKLRL